MKVLKYYFSPRSCSIVSHIALEYVEAVCDYELVNLMRGDQRRPSYLEKSPRGKVPLLEDNGRYISENVAILHWINEKYPADVLLPCFDKAARAQLNSDLAWFSSGIHPLLTRMLFPDRFVRSKSCLDGVRELAVSALVAELQILDARLAGRQWLYLDWSAADAYIFWIWQRACDGLSDTSAFSALASHSDRMSQLPAVQRALHRESEALKYMINQHNI